jgi:hypothetical protein
LYHGKILFTPSIHALFDWLTVSFLHFLLNNDYCYWSQNTKYFNYRFKFCLPWTKVNTKAWYPGITQFPVQKNRRVLTNKNKDILNLYTVKLAASMTENFIRVCMEYNIYYCTCIYHLEATVLTVNLSMLKQYLLFV